MNGWTISNEVKMIKHRNTRLKLAFAELNNSYCLFANRPSALPKK